MKEAIQDFLKEMVAKHKGTADFRKIAEAENIIVMDDDNQIGAPFLGIAAHVLGSRFVRIQKNNNINLDNHTIARALALHRFFLNGTTNDASAILSSESLDFEYIYSMMFADLFVEKLTSMSA